MIFPLIFRCNTPCFVALRFKFDDERVTKEDVKRALEEQYGGEEEVMFFSTLLLFNLYVSVF